MSDPALRARIESVPPVDLRNRDNPTRDPRVVNALWGEALMRRATPVSARPFPSDSPGPAAGQAPRGPAAEPGTGGRPLLTVAARAPLAGLPGAGAVSDVRDPRFALGATGRLFFTMGSVPRTCTAQVISSGSESLLVTAGHCLLSAAGSGPRERAQNVMFVPGYRDGSGPVGRWFAADTVVTAGWETSQDWSQDVGFVRLLPRAAVQIQKFTGALGAQFGAQPGAGTGAGGPVEVEVYGYPAAGPFDGARVQRCAGFSGGPPDPVAVGSPALGCAMTAGYSGGPWLTVRAPATLVAVSSHDFGAGSIYGADLGAAALEAFRRADTP